MVFLDKNSEKLTINRHFSENCVKIEIINKFTKDTLIFDELVDTSDSLYFYVFEGLDLSSLLDGEYSIVLFDEDNAVIEELLGVCGDYKKVRTQYQKQNNTRKVYERN